jgi:hypothetical protein
MEKTPISSKHSLLKFWPKYAAKRMCFLFSIFFRFSSKILSCSSMLLLTPDWKNKRSFCSPVNVRSNLLFLPS